jgi:tetratricopeptide (TPR) repeat protein
LILVAFFSAAKLNLFVKKSPGENSQTQIAPPNQLPVSDDKIHTDNPVVNELYLAGKHQMESHSLDSNDKAIEFFNQAIKHDPDFAHAYAGLADAYIAKARFINEPKEANYRKAEEYAVKAIALNPDLAEARVSLGMAIFKNTGNFEQAEKHFRRAIEIDPSLSSAHHKFALVLIETGRVEDALREAKIAAELEPGSSSIHYTIGATLFNDKRYSESIPYFQRAIENDKSSADAYRAKAVAQQIVGDYDGALETFRSARIISGESENEPKWILIQAQAHAGSGRREQALAALSRFFETPEYRKDPLLHIFDRTVVYQLLSDKEKAFATLAKARISSLKQIDLISQEPRLAELRTDARFNRLIEKWKSRFAAQK